MRKTPGRGELGQGDPPGPATWQVEPGGAEFGSARLNGVDGSFKINKALE